MITMASHVAAQKTETLGGVIFFGYPLHPPGNPEKRRDEHLPDIAEPMLFVQGTRDTFGTAEEIRALLPRLKRAVLFEVAGGDHSLKASSNAAKQDAVMEGVLDRTVEWIAKHI